MSNIKRMRETTAVSGTQQRLTVDHVRLYEEARREGTNVSLVLRQPWIVGGRCSANVHSGFS